MRVTLVQPAGFNFVPGQPDFSVLANRLAPIGILSLASWLEHHGHAVTVIDCLGPHAPVGTAAHAEAVLASRPELVGFSSTTSGFMDALDIAEIVKARAPAVRTIFGNVHASSIGAPLLRHFPEIDYLCIGEGEGTLLDLAEGRPEPEIDNLVYRDGEGIVGNPRRARIRHLDELPFPAFEKLAGFPRGYHLPLFSYEKRWGATMVTSRGCPYTCSFCDRTVFERLYRYNSAGYMIEHMRYLRDRFGVHHINFYDDLFTAHRGRVGEFCAGLIERPLGIDFNCAIRTGHTSLEQLKALKQAGALMVSIGIESADPGMMARHKTGVTLDEVRETVDLIHRAGLRAKGLFIFGLPGETPETLRATSDFILSLGLDEMNMTKFSPMYGAPIWDECGAGESGDFNEDWRLMNCLNFVFRPSGFESRAQMDALYNWHVRRFYDSRGYRRRFIGRLWQHRWSLWHLARNLPQVLRAARYFSASQNAAAPAAPHPRQPAGLQPTLGPELTAPSVVQVSPGHRARGRRPLSAAA
ncbi:MAG: radical SAM protein [Rhodocyclaceae bacterium]|nr:radical SAM protein [Rhodocyclaceae bacterium]